MLSACYHSRASDDGRDAPFVRDVKSVFQQYCRFGGSARDDAMDSVRFARLCVDSGFIAKGLDRSTVDSIFGQVCRAGMYSRFVRTSRWVPR